MTDAWHDADPDGLIETIQQPSFQLDAAAARSIWHRAASFRHTDPSVGYRISAALLEAADRGARVEGGPRAEGGAPPLHAPVVRAIAWTSVAESCNATGRIREAIDAFARATDLADEAGEVELLGQVLVGRVHVLALAGRASESGRLAERAETLLETHGHTALLARLYMNRGNAFYQQDRYREACDTYGRADAAFESAGIHDATRAGLYMNQAVAAMHLESFGEAQALYLRAESLSASLGAVHVEAFARFNHAFLERITGNYRVALRLLKTAEQIFNAQGSRDMSAASNRARAEIYLDLGMPASALELVVRAGETFAAENMELDRELARADQARALIAMGDATAAIPVLEASAAWFHERANHAREGLALADLARAHLAAGTPRLALEPARAALRLLDRAGLAHASAGARIVLARALVSMRRPSMAERAIKPALATAAGLATRVRMEAWSAAGAIAAARGDRPEAGRRYRRAARLVERERQFIPGVELRSRTFERFGGVYRELARLELEEARPRFDVLLALAEQARARSFHDRLGAVRTIASDGQRSPRAARGAPGARKKPGGALDERRVLLGALTRRLEESESPEEGSANAERSAQLRRRVIALENEIARELQRVDEHEAATGRRPGRSTSGSSGVASATGRHGASPVASLRPGEILLEYLILGDRVLALAADDNRGRAVRLLPASLAEIKEALERVRFQLESALMLGAVDGDGLAFARRSADDALGTLHRMLIEPVLAGFPDDGALIVVPDGFLHHVPFQCLHDGHDYLGARRVVSRLPTAGLLARRGKGLPRGKATRQAKAPGRGLSAPGVLVAGTVTGGPAFVARELAAVASCFPGEARVLSDPLTETLLAELEGARVIHLSSHGYFRDDNPVFSRLSTKDGALFVADLLDRRLTSELVVLSACQTGEVFTGGGDDLSGVAHAFLASGVRRLVASLWRVHDEATHDLMQAFYAQYVAGGGSDPAAALAAAERETRERWDHPFYWGCFSLHGI